MQESEGRNAFSMFHRPNGNKCRGIGFKKESKRVGDVKKSSKQTSCNNEIIICYIENTVISSALRRVSSGRSSAKYLLIFLV